MFISFSLLPQVGPSIRNCSGTRTCCMVSWNLSVPMLREQGGFGGGGMVFEIGPRVAEADSNSLCSWGWLRLYAAEDGLRLVITGVHKQQHTKSARRQGLNQCCAFFPIMENSTVPSLCSELALLALLVASTMAAVMSQLHLSSQFIDLWVLKLQKLCLASPLGPSICCRCPGYMQGLGGGPLMSHRLSPAFKIPSPVTCNKKSPDNSIPSCLTPPSSSSFLSWVPRLKGMEWIIYGVPCFKYTESSIKMDVYKPLIWGGVHCYIGTNNYGGVPIVNRVFQKEERRII